MKFQWCNFIIDHLSTSCSPGTLEPTLSEPYGSTLDDHFIRPLAVFCEVRDGVKFTELGWSCKLGKYSRKSLPPGDSK